MSQANSGGVIAWMTQNKVTPNLLMVVLLAGGLFTATKIKQEVFPSFDLDMVTVQVPYPGASPEEVEQGIVLAIEEAVRGIDGIEEMSSTAGQGSGSVRLELYAEADQQRVYQDIQKAVDGIRTFPIDAERAEVSLAARRREVLDMQLYGDVPERALRELAEQVRDQLLLDPNISQVDLTGVRAFEIHVEVPQEKLREYGLTLNQIAARIGESSVELPAGSIDTSGGELLLRTRDRRDWAREFATVPLVTTDNGAVVRLGDVATIREDFEESDRSALYNGKRCVGLEVYRVGEETPIGVSDAVYRVMGEVEATLPTGVMWDVNSDRSEVYKQRLELLLKNAFMGLALVLILLGLFLEWRLAFWVTMGIPISFLGGLIVLWAMGVSINMVSMFAFIVALGIVVDDAIIAGENIYEYRTRGMSLTEAAVRGAQDVAVPVTFSILSNVVAFLPLYFVPGMMGKIWKTIPLVVITVFIISLVESLLILPAHLAHDDEEDEDAPDQAAEGLATHGAAPEEHAPSGAIDAAVAWFIESAYAPLLGASVRWRAATVGIAVASLILTIGYVRGGRIGTELMPRTESDEARVSVVLPVGSPPQEAEKVRAKLLEAIDEVAAANGGEQLVRGTFARINETEVQIRAYLTQPGVRPLSTREVTKLWREAVGNTEGLESVRFESDRGGPGSGAGLTVELSHRDIATLDRAAAALARELEQFSSVKDIDDGAAVGKEQLDFKVTPAGEALGLTSSSIATQVRNAFQGANALRQQRQRNEVTVVVRRPMAERASEYDVESLIITTPTGASVPLREVAEVTRGRAYTSIARRDARRTITVTANVEPARETDQVMAALNATVLPQLGRDFPGLSYGYEGRQASRRESMQSLLLGFLGALVAIYFLLAIPFRSYTQPLIVMVAIPFGIVGAILGHVLMGYNLSVLSMMGVVALTGVVVNDSLMLVDYANKRREEDGLSAREAIVEAGVRRFRPVMLTTLTTFGGLAPLIFETSRQARFLIPMALSLAFGIVFATLITLVLVPSLYIVIDDGLTLWRRTKRRASRLVGEQRGRLGGAA